jgi:hypothetical protein
MNVKGFILVVFWVIIILVPWGFTSHASAEIIAPQEIQTPMLKWQHGGCFSSWCETGWYASPAVADFDGDGGSVPGMGVAADRGRSANLPRHSQGAGFRGGELLEMVELPQEFSGGLGSNRKLCLEWYGTSSGPRSRT